MYWEAIVVYDLKRLATKLIFLFSRLVAIAHAAAEHEKAAPHWFAFSLRVEFSAQKLRCVYLYGDIITEFTVDIISFSTAVTVYTVVVAAAVEIHAVL
jgi:hypothetical protein